MLPMLFCLMAQTPVIHCPVCLTLPPPFPSSTHSPTRLSVTWHLSTLVMSQELFVPPTFWLENRSGCAPAAPTTWAVGPNFSPRHHNQVAFTGQAVTP
eukprot:887047-Alexandrium_andersonii.AAC.1